MRPVTAVDLPYVLGLFNRELGDPVFTLAGLERDLEDPEVRILVEPGAGAALSRLLIPEDIAYYERFGDLAQRAFAAGAAGSLEALAVEPDARRSGLGTALVEASQSWFSEVGARSVLVVGWDSGRPDSSLPLLRRLEYEESPRIERFYEEESRRGGWTCPVDGLPCRCAAILFVKFL
jgi:ribosomal protein S18 acetylase RimI-like enzyme